MVSTALIHEVRHMARARGEHPESWMPALSFLPAEHKARAPRKRRRQRRRPVAAFAYYAHPGHLVVVRSSVRDFGIAPGTFIVARLRRPITSTDKALIVLRTVVPVAGRTGVLGAGSQLLARAEQVTDDRLMLTVRQVVTPHGRTIPMVAVVFSRSFRMGLSGFIEDKAPARAWRALGRSLIASADEALSLIGGGGSTPTAALGRAGRAVLAAPIRWRQVRRVLYVPPQRVEVQLERPL